MKKSLLGRCLLLALGCVLALSGMAGCGKKKVPDTEDTLEIYVQNLGYGTKWLDDEIALFKEQDWVKTKYPNLNIPKPASNAEYAYAAGQILAGAKANTADLLFTSANYNDVIGKTDKSGNRYIADLNDVFEGKVPGEEILYKDKMFAAHEQTSKYDGKYWSTMWSCMYQGFMYNIEQFEALHLTVPNTTDELLALCNSVKSGEGYTSKLNTSRKLNYTVMFSTERSEANYWQYVAFPVWWAQYEGLENYENYYKGIDVVNGVVNSKDVLSQTGRKEAMSVIKTLLHDYGYEAPSTLTFVDAQRAFLRGEGLIMVNGDWIYEEMRTAIGDYKKENILARIGFMKNPVISSIINVLPEHSVENDAELSALIKAIDAGNTALSGEGYEVRQADYDRVKAARNYVSTEYLNQAYVPAYATAKDLAKDFLRFLATDLALNQYMRSTGGAALPFTYDVQTKDAALYETFDDIQKYRNQIFMSDPAFMPSTRNEKFPLSYLGGLTAVPDGAMDSELAGNTSAEDFFQKQIKFYSGSNWDTVLRNAAQK